MPIKSLVLYLAAAVNLFSISIEAHGYLKTPRSRNWIGYEDGVVAQGPGSIGVPQRETCYHCLNRKEADNLCSFGNAATLYDDWNDINGDPMPWISEATYDEGDEITVEAVLTTNHAGHMEMWLCPDGNNSTQECLWSNPAQLVRDEYYGGPVDPTYPERAYFGNSASEFKFTYKLPEGLTGDNVLVQWQYITANSCFPPGYKNTEVGDILLELGWLRAYGMAECMYPYDPTGAVGSGKPEQFWNCAEITINPKAPTPPTVSPAPSPPTTPAPIGSPTVSPTSQVTQGYCNYGGSGSRSECDGMVEGGPWCNESQANCESSCNGKWCTTGGPNPTTPTWSPILNPTSLPTESPSWMPTNELPIESPTSHFPSNMPSSQPSVVTCVDDPDEEFFFKMKDGLPVFKTCDWLSTRSDDKRENTCEGKTDSFDGVGPAKEVCKVACGTCNTSQPSASPSIQPSYVPTSSKSPTISPSSSTELPTSSTESPTHAPSKAPSASSGQCCSNNYRTCMGSNWCDESSTNCQQCGGTLITGAPLQCIAKWDECTNDNDGCCAPATCQGYGGSYMQCL